MKCSKCGQELADPDHQAFCPSCGAKIVPPIPTIQLANCAACGSGIPEGNKFCAKCGAAAVIQDLKCRKCGSNIPEGSKFCPNCGASSIHGGTPPPLGKVKAAINMESGIIGASPDEASWQWFVYDIKNKYCEFSGRARRREFWFYALFSCIAGFILGFIPVIGWLASLALILPGLGVHVRRLHDVGKSGWYLLIGLIPIVGLIILLVWDIQEGDRGSNAYGPDPKGV